MSTFSKSDMSSWAEQRGDIKPQAAGLAYTVLEANAEALNLNVICPIPNDHRGQYCLHQIETGSFLRLQPRTIIAVKRGGPRIAWIVAEWQKHLKGGT